MGFLDRILKVGARAAERAVSKAVNDAVYDTVDKGLRGGLSQAKEAVSKPSASASATPVQKTNTAPVAAAQEDTYDDRPFAEKLPEVLKKIGDFEVQKNISPDVIEQEAGFELYPRGGCYRLPKDISYAIYKDGQRVLFINVYDSYQVYTHMANRKIKDYCDQNGTPMMDFFEYMPNELGYMEDRIRKAIG